MKKILTRVFVCVIVALCAVSTMSMCMPVKASTDDGIMPYSVGSNFSFTGSCSISRNVTGMWLNALVRATASNNNNETITLEIFVVNTGKTHTYTFLSDGQDHKYSGIYLGLSGGSNVRFTFRGANPAITIYQHLQY